MPKHMIDRMFTDVSATWRRIGTMDSRCIETMVVGYFQRRRTAMETLECGELPDGV